MHLLHHSFRPFLFLCLIEKLPQPTSDSFILDNSAARLLPALLLLLLLWSENLLE
jgi:hypothetical protein